MIYRIEIENFYSIREPQVLDFRVAANVPDDDGRFLPIYPGSDIRAPKVVAVYGANASGKTTILRALRFLSEFVTLSDGRRIPGVAVRNFNDDESASKPTRFAIEFGGIINPAVMEEGAPPEYGVLRYELEVQADAGVVQKVLWENLSQRPHGKTKFSRVFERPLSGEPKFSLEFKISGFRHLLNTMTSDASLIASFEYFDHPDAGFYSRVLGERVFTNLDTPHMPSYDHGLMLMLVGKANLLEKLNRDLSRIDVGIEQLRIESVAGVGPQGRFRHSGHRRELPWEMESQGTQAFVRLFPVLTLALEEGGLALVDEFDTLIHPLVLPEILRWFYDDEERNRSGAQLFMSCHSATLLEYLVKEEVVIAEKDSQGRTRVFSLTDLSLNEDKVSVRRTANLYKKYLSGALGGVPVIG